jgi:hypothetical protein
MDALREPSPPALNRNGIEFASVVLDCVGE